MNIPVGLFVEGVHAKFGNFPGERFVCLLRSVFVDNVLPPFRLVDGGRNVGHQHLGLDQVLLVIVILLSALW